MESNKMPRRSFIAKTAVVSVAGLVSGPLTVLSNTTNAGKLACLGGLPIRNNKTWPVWPYQDEKMMESLTAVMKSGKWCRIDAPASSQVAKFEREFGPFIGIKHVVATGSGTQALSTAVHALGIEAGDEVITSPYTDMGTISSILTSRALPILADLDPDSYQLDPDDVERKITSRTKAIMPVHMMGNAADMRKIMALAKKHKLLVIEDACQAHLATFDSQPLGGIGDVGCFSFQSSKVMPCGEGGAVATNNEQLADKCYTVQNHGTDRKGQNVTIGPKYRMNEFEASVLLPQLLTHKQRHETRNKNATYLISKLKSFPGITTQKLYPGTGDGSYYLFAMSYKKDYFDGLPRDTMIKALRAEGIPVGPYLPTGLHKHGWVNHILEMNIYRKMYPEQALKDFKEWTSNLPKCDQVCSEMLLLPGSGPLTGTQTDMDDIVNALLKVHANRAKLKSV